MSSKLTSKLTFSFFFYARTVVSAPKRSYCISSQRFVYVPNSHVGISCSRIAEVAPRSWNSERRKFKGLSSLRCSAYSTEGSNSGEKKGDGSSEESDSNNAVPKAVEDYQEIDRRIETKKAEDSNQSKIESDLNNEASEASSNVEETQSPSMEGKEDQTWVEDDGIVIYTDKEFLTKRRQKIMERRKPKLEDDDGTTPEANTDQFNLRSLLQNIQRQQDQLRDKDQKPPRTSMMSLEELVEFLRQDNARDICAIAVPPEKDYVAYFVVCSGTGSRHIGRMADHLANEVRIGIIQMNVDVSDSFLSCANLI